ncbi:MAG: HEAT repeat domain-containing protein [Myxococcota bacterium]
MLFSVAGCLTPPTDDAWRASTLDPTRFTWLDDSPVLNGEAPAGEFENAGDLLAALSEQAPPDFFVSVDFGASVEVVGRFESADGFEALAQDLASALWCLGESGATGEVVLVEPDEGFGWRISIGPDRDIEPIEGDRFLEAVEPHVGRVRIGQRVAEAREADPDGQIAALIAGERSLHLGEVDPPARRAPLEAVRAGSLQAIVAAAAEQETVASDGSPLAVRFGDAATLGAALKDNEPEVRVSAIVLLAGVDAAGAEPMAVALLDDPSWYVRAAAAQALALAGTPAAVDQLLTPPPLGAPDSHARACATSLLPEDVVLPLDARWREAVAASAAAGDMSTNAGVAAAWVLGYLTDVLVARPPEKAAELLLALFDDAPHLSARGIAFSGLQRIGGPAVEAAAERLQMYSLGMGLALNQDDARRRALLGIDAAADSGGILRFDDLDGARLEQLLDEGFIDPAARQNDAPSTVEVFDLMQAFPSVKASGYAVVLGRPDYRVHVDGLTCDLAVAPHSDRAELRAVFEELEATATRNDTDGDLLSLWWT